MAMKFLLCIILLFAGCTNAPNQDEMGKFTTTRVNADTFEIEGFYHQIKIIPFEYDGTKYLWIGREDHFVVIKK